MTDRPGNTVIGHIQNGFLARMMHYTPTAIVVWLALANRADKSGCCYPSITTLRADTGLARATIHKAIHELVEGNEISVTPGGGKGNPTNHYQIAGGPGNELVQNTNQFNSRTKVVHSTDKGSPPIELKPNTRTTHKNHTAKSPSKKSTNGSYTEEFEQFWLAVAPHKRKSKREAFKRYRETLKTLTDQHDDPQAFLLDRATAYYASPLGKTPFCNGPAPWLHQGGYDDDPVAWQRGEEHAGPHAPVDAPYPEH